MLEIKVNDTRELDLKLQEVDKDKTYIISVDFGGTFKNKDTDAKVKTLKALKEHLEGLGVKALYIATEDGKPKVSLEDFEAGVARIRAELSK